MKKNKKKILALRAQINKKKRKIKKKKERE